MDRQNNRENQIKHEKIQGVIILHREDEKKNYLLRLKTNEARGLFWQNMTGSVEKGENYQDALLRELQEETKLELKLSEADSFHPLEKKNCYEDKFGRFVEEAVFLVLFSRNEFPPLSIDPIEHIDYEWKPLDEVTSEDFYHASNYDAFMAAQKIFHALRLPCGPGHHKL